MITSTHWDANMLNKAKKVVVVTEKILLGKIVDLILAAGATGYTAVLASGQGGRGVRTDALTGHGDIFSNVKIEVITVNDEVAQKIIDQVIAKYFNNYSGIAYVEDVWVARRDHF
ncbi:MAG: hypothetical protein Q7J33_07460 [Serpentinimonas sp.]|nr:hypothetical protein [Serpentinimonas sp.]